MLHGRIEGGTKKERVHQDVSSSIIGKKTQVLKLRLQVTISVSSFSSGKSTNDSFSILRAFKRIRVWMPPQSHIQRCRLRRHVSAYKQRIISCWCRNIWCPDLILSNEEESWHHDSRKEELAAGVGRARWIRGFNATFLLVLVAHHLLISALHAAERLLSAVEVAFRLEHISIDHESIKATD